MNINIEKFNVEKFSELTKTAVNSSFYFTSRNINAVPLNIPYRRDYYFVSICLKGSATIKSNLETYQINENSLITLSPQIVKEWKFRTNSYQKLTVLFTKDFLLKNSNNINFLDEFPFFDSNTNHCIQLKDRKSVV